MTLSAHAILGRFNGDVLAAAEYCHDMMTQYPKLHEEYDEYLGEIAEHFNAKARAAHV